MDELTKDKLWDKFADNAMRILGPEGDRDDLFELWLTGFVEGYKEGKICE
jgi:hypothetical protein